MALVICGSCGFPLIIGRKTCSICEEPIKYFTKPAIKKEVNQRKHTKDKQNA